MGREWLITAILCSVMAVCSRLGTFRAGWLGETFRGYEFFAILALVFIAAHLGERISTFYLYFKVTGKNPAECDYTKPLRKNREEIPIEVREAVERRDGKKCAYHFHFGDLENWHLDHSVPVDDGGENSPENLVVSCAACNLRKSGNIQDEFLDPVLRRLWKRGKTIHRELVQMPKLWSL